MEEDESEATASHAAAAAVSACAASAAVPATPLVHLYTQNLRSLLPGNLSHSRGSAELAALCSLFILPRVPSPPSLLQMARCRVPVVFQRRSGWPPPTLILLSSPRTPTSASSRCDH